MGVEPDEREALWYSLNNFLDIDPNAIPHYWTLLIDKFKLLSDNKRKWICSKCNSSNIFQFRNKQYCYNDYQPIYVFDEEKKSEKLSKVAKLKQYDKFGRELKEDHKLVFETPMETINRIRNKILNMLIEPSSYRYDLFELESYIDGKDENAFFETKLFGDITKGEILKELSGVKTFITDELIEAKEYIRFNSVLNVPPIKM